MDADPGPKSLFSRATKKALDRGCARSTHGAVAVLESDWGTTTGDQHLPAAAAPLVFASGSSYGLRKRSRVLTALDQFAWTALECGGVGGRSHWGSRSAVALHCSFISS